MMRQNKLGSGFDSKSATTDVIKGIDLTGKIAFATGRNTGIGLETTKTLATAGTVYLRTMPLFRN